MFKILKFMAFQRPPLMARSVCCLSSMEINKLVIANTRQNSNVLGATQLSITTQRYYSAKKSKDKGGKHKPKVQLSENELNSVINYNEYLQDLKGLVDFLSRDLSENLNLRITPGVIEQLNVKTGEGMKKLGEIVQVEAKSANNFVIDLITCPEQKKSIMDALNKSNLNLNPQISQNTIYLTLPKLTREHRENVAKSAKLKAGQIIEKMKKIEKEKQRKAQEAKHVSKDLIFQVCEYIKIQFENSAKQAHDLRDAKIKEILNE